MVLTQEQIEKLKDVHEKLKKSLNALEMYCKEDMEEYGLYKMKSKSFIAFKDFNKNCEDLCEIINEEFKSILLNENTFKDFIQESGVPGYRQKQLLRELEDLVKNHLKLLDFLKKIRNQQGEVTFQFWGRLDQRYKALRDSLVLIREAYKLIESIQR